MTFPQFLSILLARWKLLSGVFAGVLVVAVLLALLLPKQYTASASVVVDAKQDPFSVFGMGALATPSFLATQVDIIRSERVAQKVARALRLTEVPLLQEQWREATDGKIPMEAWIAGSLLKQLEVQPAAQSNVIEVGYKAGDPAFAAAMANGFVSAYLSTLVELRVDPARQYSSFFDLRAKEARDALEAAQGKLSKFQREKGIVNADERLDVETARLNELSSQLVALQAISAESVSKDSKASGSSGDRLPEVLNNPIVSSLKADMSRQEARLQEMSTRLGDKHPQVSELRANIEELRKKVLEETRRVTSGVGVVRSINQDRVAQVRSDLEAQRQKVLQSKMLRDEAAVLQRDLENAQRTYDSILQRLNQSSIESQSTQTNVTALTTASPPVKPSSPVLLVNMILGVVGGLLLGVVAAFIRELSDRRVRCQDDVVELIGLPVLGVLPSPSGAKGASKLAASASQRIVGQGAGRLAAN